MENLERQFQEETKLSFDDIPINGVHLEYINWLEKRIEALSLGDVVGRSEQLKAVEKLKDFAYEVCPLHREDDLEEIVNSL